MTFKNNLKIEITKPFIQRIIYLFTLIVYIILWTVNKNYEILFQKSSIGFNYWIVDLLVIIPLFFQFCFNNKIGWTFMFMLLCFHFILTLLRVQDTYDGDFMAYIFIGILYIVPFAIMYYLYPQKLDK